MCPRAFNRLHQITVADKRWYMKPAKDAETGLPIYLPVPSVTWIAGFWPQGIHFYKWLAEKGWDEAEAIKAAAGDKGSAVHGLVHHPHHQSATAHRQRTARAKVVFVHDFSSIHRESYCLWVALRVAPKNRSEKPPSAQ
jgi:hypothetical protein